MEQDQNNNNQPERNMGFFEHIDELRVRLVRCLYVFFFGFIFSYFVTTPVIMEWLRAPLFAALPPDKQKLYFTGLFENFFTHLKIAGYSSIFLLSPYYFYELWAFIAPGLYPRERKLVVPFITSATAFFVGGALFAYYVLFPVGFKFFVHFGLSTDEALLTIDAYYSLVLKLLLLFGISFELPVIIVLLGVLGIVDAPLLRRQRRMAVMGVAVMSALFAPPDAVSMLVMMAPLLLLYEMAVLVVAWLGLRREAQKKTELVQTNDPLSGKSS